MNRTRAILFKLITVLLLPALFLIAVELGLRSVGFGFHTAVFSEEKGQVRNNWAFTFQYFPWSMARPMQPVSFLKEKPEESLRIFLLGGSAAQGFPASGFGMAAQLQILLQEAFPNRKIEVINTAITAINSHVVLPVAEACLKYEPDFLIVYVGNNEVVGPFGPGTTLAGFRQSRFFIKASTALKSTRLHQLITLAMGRHKSPAGSWRGMNQFLQNTVARDDSRLQAVYEHYDANLRELLNAADKEDCTVIVSTVAVNLRGNPPFASKQKTSLSEEESSQWGNYFRRGREFQEKGQYGLAIDAYLSANRIDHGYSELHYRLGQCYLAVEEESKAEQAFVTSRDLDVLRFRADSQLNAILRNLPEGTLLVDNARNLMGAFKEPPDEELLVDHVHHSFKGNYLVARSLAEAIMAQTAPPANSFPDETETARLLAFSDWDRHLIAKKLAGELLNKPPFTNQLGHRQRQVKRQRQVSRLAGRLTPGELSAIENQFRELLEIRPRDRQLRFRFSEFLRQTGNPSEARKLLRQLVDGNPHDFATRLSLAYLTMEEKDFESSERHLTFLLKQNPYAIEVRSEFLRLLVERGDLDHAETYSENLVEDHPQDPDIRYLSGLIQLARGNKIQALEQFRQACQIDSTHNRAWKQRVQLIREHGYAKTTLTEVEAWMKADPHSTDALVTRAELSMDQREYFSAEKSYRRALELNPDLFQVRSMWVQTMTRLGRIDQAISLLQEDLKADPDIREGHSILGLTLDFAGRKGEAIEVYERGLKRQGNSPKILRELAWIYSTAKDDRLRNGPRALELCRQALTASPSNPDLLQVLAAALAENRQFEEALETATQALELARAQNQDGLADLISRCLSAYEQHLPLRAD